MHIRLFYRNALAGVLHLEILARYMRGGKPTLRCVPADLEGPSRPG
jgi:hypothetical protein